MARYRAAGMRRIILRVTVPPTGSGVEEVRRLEPFLRQAEGL